MISFSKLKTNLSENCDFSDIILLSSFVLVGGFNDYISCLISVALLPYLFFKIHKNKSLNIKLNLFSVTVFAVVLFYGLTTFWAIDSGMAFIGFLKFLPVLLYMVALWQSDKRKNLLEFLPYFVAVIGLVCAIGSLITPIRSFFLVSERLSGSFQYPNTFALILLVSELLVLKKSQLKIIDYVTIAVLIGCLLYTGSRTVFLLFLVSNFIMVLVNASKKTRISIFAIAGVVVIAVLAVAVLGEEGNVFSRYLKIGLTQSTFVGRLLYVVDALPLLLKYPFGMGYLGYHFVQGSIQTGVYNVSYVHNDFLQIALDVGIVPALLFLAAVVGFFCKRKVSLADKVIAGAFAAHSLFDFNLQFVGMFMLFVLLMNDNSGKEIVIKKIGGFKIALPIVLALNLYMCISLALSQFTLYEAADALYPYNTRNKLLLLEQQEDVTLANEIADEILAQNIYYYAPYSVKSKYCYSKGDFVGVIENKNATFLRNRFRYTEYKEYGVMLVNGIIAYEEMGDSASATVLKKELLSLKEGIESNKNKISKLGSMINEQPVTQLPGDILDYIDKITNEAGELN